MYLVFYKVDIFSGFVFLIILIGTNYVTYNSLKTDYKSQISSLGGKLDNLDSELNDTESKLLNKIDEEREFSTNQRKAIEEKKMQEQRTKRIVIFFREGFPLRLCKY